MNKIFNYVFALAIVAFVFASCSKDGSTSPSSNTPAMAALINGQLWNAGNVYTSKQTTAPAETIIFGKDSTNKGVTIGLFDYAGTTGTFTIGGSNAKAYAIYTPNGSLYDNASSGTVIVSSVTAGIAKGTFEFTTANSVVVTSGTFTATLP
ncbi:MAG: hypothetical protein H0X33_06320 [Taibaiella sp.]|nr:hypothetical protein [Taibaiella sp.]